MDVSRPAEDYFKVKLNTFYFEGLFKVKGIFEKCVILGGDYVDK